MNDEIMLEAIDQAVREATLELHQQINTLTVNLQQALSNPRGHIKHFASTVPAGAERFYLSPAEIEQANRPDSAAFKDRMMVAMALLAERKNQADVVRLVIALLLYKDQATMPANQYKESAK